MHFFCLLYFVQILEAFHSANFQKTALSEPVEGFCKLFPTYQADRFFTSALVWQIFLLFYYFRQVFELLINNVIWTVILHAFLSLNCAVVQVISLIFTKYLRMLNWSYANLLFRTERNKFNYVYIIKNSKQ